MTIADGASLLKAKDRIEENIIDQKITELRKASEALGIEDKTLSDAEHGVYHIGEMVRSLKKSFDDFEKKKKSGKLLTKEELIRKKIKELDKNRIKETNEVYDPLMNANYKELETSFAVGDRIFYKENKKSHFDLFVFDNYIEKTNAIDAFKPLHGSVLSSIIKAHISLNSEQEIDKFMKINHLLNNKENYLSKNIAIEWASAFLGLSQGTMYHIRNIRLEDGLFTNPHFWIGLGIGVGIYSIGLGTDIYRRWRVGDSEKIYDEIYRPRMTFADKSLEAALK